VTPSKTTAIHPEPFTTSAGKLLCAAVVALVTACGGGGESTAPAPVTPPTTTPPTTTPPTTARKLYDPEWLGSYGATVSGTTPQQLIVATSPNWGFLAVYGDGAENDFQARGLFYSWDVYSSYPLRHRGPDAAGEATIDVVLDPAAPTLSGTLLVAGEQKSIAGGTLAAVGYRFDQPASLTAVAGRWEMTTSQGRRLSIDITQEGTITGTSGECSLYDSRLAPTKTGNGVFAVNLLWQGNANCREAGAWLAGFAVVYSPMAGGTQLVIGAWDGWDGIYLAASGKR